ncbi:uncharacterized protein METZ01_LOCUS312706 [marine metagenome]|uniref:Uncharacterized protein n=1 Tax=marine metagenome TaxID=408172 RepID=A0A382NJI3_9ZZZZ
MNEIERLQQLAGIVNEEDVTKVAVGHVDDETGMISKELYHIGKNAVDIHKMLKELPDSDFPHWWQAKIIKAHEYVKSAKDFLDAELNASDEDEQEIADLDRAGELEQQQDQDPSGVS